jgi:outer membrane protease
MKLERMLLAVVLVITMQTVASAGGLKLSAGVDVHKMFGSTVYHINLCEYYPDEGLTLCADSELGFPLDMYLASVDLEAAGKIGAMRPWSLKVTVQKNLNDPKEPMTDKDWFSIPEEAYQLTFSDTESDAEIDAMIVDFKGRVGLFATPAVTLEAMAGYRYMDFSFEIFGVRGWYLDMNLNRVYYDVLKGENVLDYDVTFYLPYVGVASHMKASPELGFDVEAAYSPSVTAEDLDDHVLRNKKAEAQCTGSAFLGSIEATYSLGGGTAKPSWWIRLGLDFVSIDTEGDQDQVFYADDPGTPDTDETGMRFDNVDDEITSSTMSVYMKVGVTF